MAFPAAWPPRLPSGRRSIRFFASGTTTGAFDGNAFLFFDDVGANTFTPTPYVAPGSTAAVKVGDLASPSAIFGTGRNANDVVYTVPASEQNPFAYIWSGTIRIFNDGANPIEFSFDGTNVQGVIKTTEALTYRDRHESGISLRFPGGGAGSAFRVEAW